jgi:SAM-dependent methyltransferase
MNESPEDRTAKWLVGDRLSCVLHLGDAQLAYQLAEQGHEVVVAGDDVTSARHPDIQYVRSRGERLPFLADAFDVVIVPELREAQTALAEYARVLRADGLLSTISRRHDDSIPWMRKLREITGARDATVTHADTFSASGLFREPETHEVGTWEKLDLPGLLRASLGRRGRAVTGPRSVHGVRRADRIPPDAPRDAVRPSPCRQGRHGAGRPSARHDAARLPLSRITRSRRHIGA